MSEEEMVEPGDEATGKWTDNRRLVLLVVLGVVGLLAVVIFGFLLLRNRDGGEDGNTPVPVDTRVAAAVPTAVPYQVFSSSQTMSVTLESPVSLRVLGQDFSVRAQAIPADGAWVPAAQGEGSAVWVYGSIINYVIGLPYSRDNQNLLEQLALGDDIVLITRGEREFVFSFNNRRQVPATNRDIFAQSTPGITLVLLGDTSLGEERLVVQGTYVVPEPESGRSDSVFEIGDPAQLESVQITVNGATYLPDRPEAPPGFAFFLVDYQIQNTGLTALDTSLLQMSLLDSLGNTYALNSQASQLGNYPPLSGFLNSGQLASVTVGYQIPVGLVSPNLNWTVLQTNTGAQIQVTIPFNAGGGGGQGTVISLNSVNVSSDLTSLNLSGTVVNGGTQPLVIGEQSVSLRTNDGSVYLLLSTNPAFPWSVAPGQTVQFAVSFQRPSTATSAVFTVLNQQFELSNLR
ncbi:MAG: DUF4352 domain-containing protein [Ardenticatenaceae bacterium]|nr:DUF4352 domain-containing protein [Ardenticatenaceae bacterium]